MIKNYILVTYEDWEGLYLNENLITEGHTIPVRFIITELEYGYNTFEYVDIEGDWLNDTGYLPATYTELVNLEIERSIKMENGPCKQNIL